jgi:hypothetical protein
VISAGGRRPCVGVVDKGSDVGPTLGAERDLLCDVVPDERRKTLERIERWLARMGFVSLRPGLSLGLGGTGGGEGSW